MPGTGLPSTPIILFIFSAVLVSHFIGGVNQGKEVKEGTQGHTVGGKLECASVPYNSSTPFSTITNTALRKKKKKKNSVHSSFHSSCSLPMCLAPHLQLLYHQPNAARFK